MLMIVVMMTLIIVLIVVMMVSSKLSHSDSATISKELRKIIGPEESYGNINRVMDELRNSQLDGESIMQNILNPLKNLKIALIVVDFQNDFISGSLPIGLGDAHQEPTDIFPHLNSLLREKIDLVVYTQDWHEKDHISFYKHAKDGDRNLSEEDAKRELAAFDKVKFEKPSLEQVLYPTHCVQNTWGAKLHSELHIVRNAHIIKKGNDKFMDAHSPFFDCMGNTTSDLHSLLQQNGIGAVLICGLAYDICVYETVKDAANLNYLTAVIADCSSGLSIARMREIDEEYRKIHVAVINHHKARKLIRREVLPIEWVEKKKEYYSV